MDDVNVALLLEISQECAGAFGVAEDDFNDSWDILEYKCCLGKPFYFSEPSGESGHSVFGFDTDPTLGAIIIGIVTGILFEIGKFGLKKIVETFKNKKERDLFLEKLNISINIKEADDILVWVVQRMSSKEKL